MKILFLMQLPPPVHGASVVNKCIKDSAKINSSFDARYINTAPSSDIREIGVFNFKKVFSFISILFNVIKTYLSFKPNKTYITLSPYGIAFYKDAILCLLIKALGGTVIFHMHGKGVRKEVSSSKVKKVIYRFVFKNVDVIHLSESLFVDLELVRDKNKSINCLNNGISNTAATSEVKKNGVFTFVYLSNIGPSKGAHYLVEAAEILNEKYANDFKIEIYGKSNNDEYLKTIEERIDGSGLVNVRLCGPIYGDEKFIALSKAHVFVLPTRYRNECFPLSILEAMSCSLPIISTDEGAISDIVDDKVGIILEELTPTLLAEAMEKYIQNRGVYESSSQSSFEKFEEKYTIAAFETNLITIFNRI